MRSAAEKKYWILFVGGRTEWGKSYFHNEGNSDIRCTFWSIFTNVTLIFQKWFQYPKMLRFNSWNASSNVCTFYLLFLLHFVACTWIRKKGGDIIRVNAYKRNLNNKAYTSRTCISRYCFINNRILCCDSSCGKLCSLYPDNILLLRSDDIDNIYYRLLPNLHSLVRTFFSIRSKNTMAKHFVIWKNRQTYINMKSG